MNGDKLQHKVLITNPEGFHLRPASAFAEVARRFRCAVIVSKEPGKGVDGKSPLELMLLGADQGTTLIVEVDGPDAQAALSALIDRLNTPIEEDEPGPSLPPKG